jgi:putative copper resistance protein D
VTEFLHVIPAWLELIFLTLCIGTLVCRLWVFDAPAAAASSHEKIPERLWLLFRIGTAAIMACALADLLIAAAEMSEGPVASVFPALPTVILKTHFGRVWIIRIAALLLLTVTMQAGRRYRESRGVLFFMLSLGLIIAMTESASGHASDAGDFSVAEIVDWLHILAASVWGGGLFALAVIILPRFIKQDDWTAIARAAGRFSRIAGYAVGVIAVTSLYNAWSYVGSFAALLKSAYGLTVLAKIILLFFLIQFGAFNRYVSVPLLRERAGMSPARRGVIDRFAHKLLSPVRRKQDQHHSASRFLRIVRIEAVLVVAALLCAALLRHEVPARHFSHLGHAQTAGGHANHEHAMNMHYAVRPESVAVRLETNPKHILAGTPVSITVYLEDRKGRPLQGLQTHHERILHTVIIGKDLNVFAHIHPEDLGALTSEMLGKATFSLRYTFPKAGNYLIGVDFATKDGIYSKTAHLNVFGKPLMGAAKIDFSKMKNFGPYRVLLKTSPEEIRAGEETTLEYFIQKDGKPVTDLEPYLGAAMHLAVVSADLTQFMHAHGALPGETQAHLDHMHAMPPEKFGPEIDAYVVFPTQGIYKIFVQVQHNGKVLLFDFMVKVQ